MKLAGRSLLALMQSWRLKAYGQRGGPQGLLFHSDYGCQYSSRLFGSLKTEWIPAFDYVSRTEAAKDIGHYLMNYYDWHRRRQKS